MINEDFLARNFSTYPEPLGVGRNSTVYLTCHVSTAAYYALKVPFQNQPSIDSQKILNELNEVNGVPKLRLYTNTYLEVIDYFKNGALFDICLLGCFDEPKARYISYQICNVVFSFHQRNVAHFDLKLDNILLNENFNLKICDFGYANNARGFTQGYAPPEQLSQQIRNKYKCDTFAIGVIIYILVMGFPPFQNLNDQWFNMIAKGDWEIYWTRVSEQAKKTPSNEFKILIQHCLQPDPNFRCDLQFVLNSDWFQLEIADRNSCENEMRRRKEIRKKINDYQI